MLLLVVIVLLGVLVSGSQLIGGNQVGIVPQTLITSGNGDANGGLLTAWLVGMLQEGSSNGGAPATPAKAANPAGPSN